MSETWKSKDRHLKRDVVLKSASRSMLRRSPAAESRLVLEAKILAMINHPGVCKIYDIVHERGRGRKWIVMPYLEGETLEYVLAMIDDKGKREGRRRRISRECGIAIAICIARASEAAHQYGVVHRDIKTGNVVLSARGPVLIDFGIASVCDSARRMTRPDEVLGTCFAMAPEQFRGEKATPQTDVFGLGVLFYELLTGRLPFLPGDKTRKDFLPVTAINRDLPDEIDILLSKALHPDWSCRFASGGEFADAVQESLSPSWTNGVNRWLRTWNQVLLVEEGRTSSR